ncbi:MAG: hypothetical protein GF317_23390 [Candidatus Lokiarchaeota archaeon]|nr:hypothetical protein [Candidatus Lokiarchaeota archaeon]
MGDGKLFTRTGDDRIIEINANERDTFLGSAINASRQITLTHELNRNVVGIVLIDNNGDSIDTSNYSIKNLSISQVRITCNFPYSAGDTITYLIF